MTTEAEVIPRARVALPDLRTLTLEQFVDFFVDQIDQREDLAELRAGAIAVHERAQALAIADQPAFEGAAAELATTKKLADQSEEIRFGITRPIDNLKKRVMELFRPTDAALEITDRHVRGLMSTYKAEQDRREREARRQAEEKARREREELERKAREERQKAEAEAEEKRRAAAAAEEAGRLAEAAKLRTAAAATVEKAENKAEKLLDRAADVTAAPPPMTAAPAKAKGVADRKVWKYEITNRDLVPDEFYVIDEKRIADRVKSLKGDTKIPGVRVWSEDDFSVRRK